MFPITQQNSIVILTPPMPVYRSVSVWGQGLTPNIIPYHAQLSQSQPVPNISEILLALGITALFTLGTVALIDLVGNLLLPAYNDQSLTRGIRF